MTTTTDLSGISGNIKSPVVQQSPAIDALNSDFLVILAALLCGLICVLGLFAISRCAWIRRIVAGNSAPPPQLPSPPVNKGLKKKILNSLPKFSYTVKQAATFSECAICLMEFVAGDEIRVMPQCGHGFHVGCIDTWLGSHSSCPSCRQIPVVARCHKCGELPVASLSTSVGGELAPRGYHVNAFLP